ncbi:hypothetical protein [Flammeovirga kamogawensis]|uniref:Uncharacterized protein n=1 Tax=Flammeovirga kamogawensis TaxID=373891 RepID=A0ABX8H4Y6_9BACT|nr:hypothetical protein [Flammeovirga kamogawensis]MBB6461891.1 hypothetical protein [Flammeovirga kamogawensis]QWG10497.1 hypothetical protein KM029_26345 [Flammeovirga kamogawensis]
MVDAWKKVDDLGDNAFDQLRKDPDFLKKFDDVANDADLNKHLFEGDLKLENGDIRGVSGVHSKDAVNIPDGQTSGFNQGDIRFKSGTKNPANPSPDDYYTAKVEVYGKKYDAQGNSFDGWHNKKIYILSRFLVSRKDTG